MYAFLTFDEEEDARALVESTEAHTIQGDTLNVDYASPIQKDGPRSNKSPESAFNDTMDQFVEQIYYGKLGKMFWWILNAVYWYL